MRAPLPPSQALLITSRAAVNYAYGGAGWGVPTAPDYAGAGSGTCSTGRNQSPINLVSESSSTLVVTALPPLNLNYETTTAWTMAATCASVPASVPALLPPLTRSQ